MAKDHKIHDIFSDSLISLEKLAVQVDFKTNKYKFVAAVFLREKSIPYFLRNQLLINYFI